LAGREAEARKFAASIQRAHAGYRVDDFLRAFRFDAGGEALVRQAARRIGLS
jgi:hypothetical protein